MAGSLGIMSARQWSACHQGGGFWPGPDAYLEAMETVIGLDLPEFANQYAWRDCSLHGGFRVLHEEFCLVSDRPVLLKRDAENRPHCEDGPSHKWRDGWSLYHWHGQSVPAEWIEDRQSLTAEIAITWPNVEQRRAACEILGWANVLREIGSTVIDSDARPDVGTLVEATIDDAPERFLLVKCGTGRDFAMHVDRQCRTAMQAQAWMHGMSESDFQLPDVRT